MSSFACLAVDDSSSDSEVSVLEQVENNSNLNINYASTQTIDENGWTDVKTVKKSGTTSSNAISNRRATDLQKSLKIDKFRDTIMSQESLNLQADGWIYDRVIKNTGPAAFCTPSNTKDVEYTHITIPNNWSDQIIFKRPKQNETPQKAFLSATSDDQ